MCLDERKARVPDVLSCLFFIEIYCWLPISDLAGHFDFFLGGGSGFTWDQIRQCPPSRTLNWLPSVFFFIFYPRRSSCKPIATRREQSIYKVQLFAMCCFNCFRYHFADADKFTRISVFIVYVAISIWIYACANMLNVCQCILTFNSTECVLNSFLWISLLHNYASPRKACTFTQVRITATTAYRPEPVQE